MIELTRREWLATVGATLVAPCSRAADADAEKLPLGFSLYGMKSLALPEAIRVCCECGYDGVELALMPGYHADPAKLTAVDRKDIRKRLSDAGLALHGLMENLPALGTDAVHKSNLERLKAAVDLANELVPSAPPPLETILGGKPAEWDKVKDALAARLVDWAAVGKAAKVVLAVKPHVGNALHTIDGAKWLMKQVDSPWLRLAFDFSHFTLRGVKLADAITGLIPLSVFVHVKDAKGTADKFEFLLPGEHGTDYGEYARLLAAAKYTGPVVVEVSGQVSGKPGYDANAAARTCHKNLAAHFGRQRKR